ncbi:hypothetical protein LptCag_1391 [Leptospirillum ferriphilum]|uniref:Uncharacterized protein n=1 Tax=Leptospirillum ferriphilum TaxID=178606 RepID=A0A094YKE1_9BACT|nr:hypothetical protein LptCag_1391 [Leptospirillum ferriphilum]
MDPVKLPMLYELWRISIGFSALISNLSHRNCPNGQGSYHLQMNHGRSSIFVMTGPLLP